MFGLGRASAKPRPVQVLCAEYAAIAQQLALPATDACRSWKVCCIGGLVLASRVC